MYGYVSDSNNTAADEILLDEYEEFEKLKAEFPEHEVFMFSGEEVDMALFCAPGVLAMLIKTKDSV